MEECEEYDSYPEDGIPDSRRDSMEGPNRQPRLDSSMWLQPPTVETPIDVSVRIEVKRISHISTVEYIYLLLTDRLYYFILI